MDTRDAWALAPTIRTMKHSAVFTFLFLLYTSTSFGQNVFPEKFTGCNTDNFALENDSILAPTPKQELINTILGSLTQKQQQKLKGQLYIQIIVDLEGNSCLMSTRNETNIPTKKTSLKSKIDSELKWTQPNKKFAALLLLKFAKGKDTEITRLGFNGNTGWRTLE